MIGQFMKNLPKTFQSKGWTHHFIKRDGVVAMYRRWRTGFEGLAKESHFEVIRIRKSQGGKAFGVVFEAGERYPGSEQWGTCGKTLLSREEADQAFVKMCVCCMTGERRNRFDAQKT